MVHQLNIGIHVFAGTIAMVIGLLAIIYNQKVALHKKLGRYFLYLIAIVIVTAFIGFFLFRNNPFLLMLTLLSMYVSYAGFRNVQLKERRSTIFDALVAIAVLVVSIAFVVKLSMNQATWNPSVVLPTMGALWLVTGYDLVKFLLLHPLIKKWWLYEHIYKMISAFSALVSAFSGNVLRDFHPYSQILPSVFCTMMIIWLITRNVRTKRIEFLTFNGSDPSANK
jgi:uncharacterized membrane protein